MSVNDFKIIVLGIAALSKAIKFTRFVVDVHSKIIIIIIIIIITFNKGNRRLFILIEIEI